MNYTSIEQSKHLLELGLKAETADMFHFIHEVDTVGFGYKKDAADFYSTTNFDYIPCWSVDSLTNILKCCDRLECHLRVDKRWNIFAVKDGNIFDSFRTDFHAFDSIFDAYYTVLVWLLENNYIKKGDSNE